MDLLASCLAYAGSICKIDRMANVLPWKRLTFILGCCVLPLNSYAEFYAGGSILLHPFPYHNLPYYNIKLGSSKLNVLANGISINVGYKICFHRYALATELDTGNFSDADGEIKFNNIEHYVSASYYLALKQKFGVYLNHNFLIFGTIGLSQNSIGDRVYITAKYYNKKQLSALYGLGIEYYTMRYKNLALFAEWFYFTPTNKTLYSGGAKPPGYSLSTAGGVLQFGMRYYFA